MYVRTYVRSAVLCWCPVAASDCFSKIQNNFSFILQAPNFFKIYLTLPTKIPTTRRIACLILLYFKKLKKTDFFYKTAHTVQYIQYTCMCKPVTLPPPMPPHPESSLTIQHYLPSSPPRDNANLHVCGLREPQLR